MKLSKLGDGLIHVISPIGGSEHTLCGIAQDAADSEGSDLLRWGSPRKRGWSRAQSARRWSSTAAAFASPAIESF